MSSSSLGSTMLASLASLMSIASQASKKLNKLGDFTLWSVSLFFNEAILGVGGGRLLEGGVYDKIYTSGKVRRLLESGRLLDHLWYLAPMPQFSMQV